VLLALAAEHPERVRGAVFVGAAVQLEDRPNPVLDSFEVERESYHGWQRWNAHHWLQDQAGFARFFFGEAFPEPHSTRQVEEAVGWALETDPDTLVATKSPKRRVLGADEARAAAARVACPAVVVHGDDDRIAPLRDGRALAGALGVPLELVAGGGHCVPARHPVWFNARLRRFVEEVDARARG
jgi:pimeloyl-ACP methyl ester carboxylesterase